MVFLKSVSVCTSWTPILCYGWTWCGSYWYWI